MQAQHDKKYSLPNYYFIEENDYSGERAHSPPPNQSQPYFQGSASQGSYVESMTPQRMNRIVDWSRNHVTPGDSKNIFPQVIAPSIEFSHDNSVSLNLNSMHSSHKPQQPRFQKKHDSPRGAALSQELAELYEKLNSKQTMVNALKSQYQDVQRQMQQKESQHEKELTEAVSQIRGLKEYAEMVQKEVRERDMYINDVDEQMNRMKDEFRDLHQCLEQEKQARAEDMVIIKQFKTREEAFLQNQLGFTEQKPNEIDHHAYEELQRECLNYKKQVAQLRERLSDAPQPRNDRPNPDQCQNCHACKEELASMIQECSLESEAQLMFNGECLLPQLVRDVTTLLLTKQREQIDMAIEQYETQQQEMTSQIQYFRDQNDEVINENNRIQDQIQNLLQEKDKHEQILFMEFERMKQEQESLSKQLQQEKQKVQVVASESKPPLEDNNYRLKLLQDENKQLQEQINSQQIHSKQQSQSLQQKYDHLRQEKENLQSQINQLLLDQKARDQSHKKNKANCDRNEKAIQALNEEKQKLQQRLMELEAGKDQQKALVQLEDRCEKAEKQYKSQQSKSQEMEKKNIELYNQVKSLQATVKQNEELTKSLKEESEKTNKMISHKTQQIKTLMDQNKSLQDKNTELSARLIALSEQVEAFEEGIRHQKSMEMGDSQRLDLSPTLERPSMVPQGKLMEMHEQITQYQREFQQVKKVLTERIMQQEHVNKQLMKEAEQLRSENNEIAATNEYLFSENQHLKQAERKMGSIDEAAGRTTSDSLNLRSFLQGRQTHHEFDEQDTSQRKIVTNVFQHHLQSPSTITELVQPEMLSVEETIALLRDVLQRAVRSGDVMRALLELPEIKELLMAVMYVEDRMKEAEKHDPHFHKNKNRLLNSIILNSNLKSILGSDQSRKRNLTSDKRNTSKASHRSNWD